ncbi:MAG: TIGR03759 family integrating conjugative element protein [Candidatus Thiodiazotropha sp. 6PLUC3]
MTNYFSSFCSTSTRALAFFLSATFFSIAYGDEVKQTGVEISNLNSTAVNAEAMGFDGWGLSETETERYQRIMKGPRGNWTPNLSPLQVLGINAESVQERQHYARRLAIIEHDRLVRERAFEKAYLAEYAKLYPNAPLYEGAPAFAKTKKVKHQRKRVNITLPCDIQSVCYKRIAPTLAKATSKPVDLYFFGVESVDDIQTWAREIGIDPDRVRQKLITLNVGEIMSSSGECDIYVFCSTGSMAG